MPQILFTLILLDAAALGYSFILGLGLGDAASKNGSSVWHDAA